MERQPFSLVHPFGALCNPHMKGQEATSVLKDRKAVTSNKRLKRARKNQNSRKVIVTLYGSPVKTEQMSNACSGLTV